jgi:hypothetical protein
MIIKSGGGVRLLFLSILMHGINLDLHHSEITDSFIFSGVLSAELG